MITVNSVAELCRWRPGTVQELRIQLRIATHVSRRCVRINFKKSDKREACHLNFSVTSNHNTKVVLVMYNDQWRVQSPCTLIGLIYTPNGENSSGIRFLVYAVTCHDANPSRSASADKLISGFYQKQCIYPSMNYLLFYFPRCIGTGRLLLQPRELALDPETRN